MKKTANPELEKRSFHPVVFVLRPICVSRLDGKQTAIFRSRSAPPDRNVAGGSAVGNLTQ